MSLLAWMLVRIRCATTWNTPGLQPQDLDWKAFAHVVGQDER